MMKSFIQTRSVHTSLLFSLLLADFATSFQLSYNMITPNANANAYSIAYDSTTDSNDIMTLMTSPSFGCRSTRNNFKNRRVGSRVLGGRRCPTDLNYHNCYRDADQGEILAGGQRYEMVELPDSMVDTTVFVGNLCEFVTDDMLSTLFTSHTFVPACVARKPNMSSLKYGFVTFPTVAEKEAAIIKFTGYELNNKKMKVEEIHDYKYRVRVPEKLVVYALGEPKPTRTGQTNTMRRVTNSREGDVALTSSIKSPYKNNRRKSKKRSQASSSSSMLSSNVTGYKNKKRREKRKNRRKHNSNKWENYGLS